MDGGLENWFLAFRGAPRYGTCNVFLSLGCVSEGAAVPNSPGAIRQGLVG